MRVHLVDVARQLAVHPRDLASAVDRGLLECWDYQGPYVDEDQAAALDLPACRWLSISQWAAEHGTYYRAVRNMIAAGELNRIQDSLSRR